MKSLAIPNRLGKKQLNLNPRSQGVRGGPRLRTMSGPSSAVDHRKQDSVPAAQVQTLLDALEKAAKTTATPVDDQAVSAGRLLATLLTGQQPGLVTTAPESATAAPAPAITAVVTVPAAAPSTSEAPTELGSAG